jgi:hypothetical protein
MQGFLRSPTFHELSDLASHRTEHPQDIFMWSARIMAEQFDDSIHFSVQLDRKCQGPM